MSLEELMEWRAYFKIQNENTKAAKPKKNSSPAAIMAALKGYENRRK